MASERDTLGEWGALNTAEPENPNYSILSSIGDAHRGADGKFLFKLAWPRKLGLGVRWPARVLVLVLVLVFVALFALPVLVVLVVLVRPCCSRGWRGVLCCSDGSMLTPPGAASLQPGQKAYNIFKQSSNPARSHVVSGYEPVDINYGAPLGPMSTFPAWVFCMSCCAKYEFRGDADLGGFNGLRLTTGGRQAWYRNAETRLIVTTFPVVRQSKSRCVLPCRSLMQGSAGGSWYTVGCIQPWRGGFAGPGKVEHQIELHVYPPKDGFNPANLVNTADQPLAPSGTHEKSFPRGGPTQHLAQHRNPERSKGHLTALD